MPTGRWCAHPDVDVQATYWLKLTKTDFSFPTRTRYIANTSALGDTGVCVGSAVTATNRIKYIWAGAGIRSRNAIRLDILAATGPYSKKHQ